MSTETLPVPACTIDPDRGVEADTDPISPRLIVAFGLPDCAHVDEDQRAAMTARLVEVLRPAVEALPAVRTAQRLVRTRAGIEAELATLRARLPALAEAERSCLLEDIAPNELETEAAAVQSSIRALEQRLVYGEELLADAARQALQAFGPLFRDASQQLHVEAQAEREQVVAALETAAAPHAARLMQIEGGSHARRHATATLEGQALEAGRNGERCPERLTALLKRLGIE